MAAISIKAKSRKLRLAKGDGSIYVKMSADRKSSLTTCDFQACRFDVFDFSASKSKV
jgi:hypothetical protein